MDEKQQDRPQAALTQAYGYCETLLREHDKDRFLADLFLPAKVRPHAQALHAFSYEIARVRDVVSEPMPGEIRHQWWRDALANPARDDIIANPVAAALTHTLTHCGLPSAPLLALIEARGSDLYDDPMPDMATLEAYCRDTSSVLFRLVAATLASANLAEGQPARDLDDDRDFAEQAATHGGIAYAFTGLIRAFALHAAQGRVYAPLDLLQRHGSSHEEALGGRATPQLRAAIGDWRKAARRHLAAAKAAIRDLPRELGPAFLPLALCEPYLHLTEATAYDPFRTPIELPQWRRQWILWWG